MTTAVFICACIGALCGVHGAYRDGIAENRFFTYWALSTVGFLCGAFYGAFLIQPLIEALL